MKVLILIFALCFAGAFGFVEFDNPCRDTVPAKGNFALSLYTGNWFEILHSLNGDDDDMVQCVQHRYTRRGLQPVLDSERIGFFQGSFLSEDSIVRVAFPEEEPLRALFNGTFDRPHGGSIEYFYRIYASDYVNYAISWSCVDLPNSRSREEISVLGRSTTLTESVFARVRNLLEEIGLERHIFRYIIHTPESCGLGK